MALISLQVLSRISFGAQMDFTLFSSDEEKMSLVLVEIEAHTTGKTVEECFLLVFNEPFVLINNQPKLDDFFSLELIFHEGPVGDPTV